MENLLTVRHYLHQHPEVSQQEFNTQKYILKLLEELNPDRLEKVASTGIIACFNGNEPGMNILLRADIDALPIQETNTDLEYKSKKFRCIT